MRAVRSRPVRSYIKLLFGLTGLTPKLRAAAHGTYYSRIRNPRSTPSSRRNTECVSTVSRCTATGFSPPAYLRRHMHAWLILPMRRHFIMTAVCAVATHGPSRRRGRVMPAPSHGARAAFSLASVGFCSSLCGLIMLSFSPASIAPAFLLLHLLSYSRVHAAIHQPGSLGDAQ